MFIMQSLTAYYNNICQTATMELILHNLLWIFTFYKESNGYVRRIYINNTKMLNSLYFLWC